MSLGRKVGWKRMPWWSLMSRTELRLPRVFMASGRSYLMIFPTTRILERLRVVVILSPRFRARGRYQEGLHDLTQANIDKLFDTKRCKSQESVTSKPVVPAKKPLPGLRDLTQGNIDKLFDTKRCKSQESLTNNAAESDLPADKGPNPSPDPSSGGDMSECMLKTSFQTRPFTAGGGSLSWMKSRPLAGGDQCFNCWIGLRLV